MSRPYDFGGWATKNDLLCADGRIIRKHAFKDNDGSKVPLVWNHQHNDPCNVLGHAILENRDEGVYAKCYFNGNPVAKDAQECVVHGDIDALSIWANRLKQVGKDVIHGVIREVSLVYAPANPGATIEEILQHDEEDDIQMIIWSGESLDLYHAEEEKKEDTKDAIHAESEVTEITDDNETLQDVFDTLTDKQKSVVYAMIAEVVSKESDDDAPDAKHNDEEDNNRMKFNVFDGSAAMEGDMKVLSHAEKGEIFADAKRLGSLRESFISHGITDIEMLFPEAKLLNTPPEMITRDMSWVKVVMNGVHKTPFSRIKSMFADLTEDDARAKGYIKGSMKKEQFFGLMKRTTVPTTIYKKQKLDRDDAVDIVDFDVVAWLKVEMRFMLEEEIARAILVGDGRDPSSDDKINPLNIRPIWTDDDLFTIKVSIPVTANMTVEEKCKAIVKGIIKARKDYKGSGSPTFFTSEDVLTDFLLVDDGIGHPLYDSAEKVANRLRVSTIVTAPILEGLKRTRADSAVVELVGIIVNLRDYNVGADKGGQINTFDDFDIDFNQQKYLIETRISGALIAPYSAMAIELVTTP